MLFTESLSDTLTLTDLYRGLVRFALPNTDSFSLSEVALRGFSKSSSESITIAEANSIIKLITITEQLLFTETYAVNLDQIIGTVEAIALNEFKINWYPGLETVGTDFTGTPIAVGSRANNLLGVV